MLFEALPSNKAFRRFNERIITLQLSYFAMLVTSLNMNAFCG